LITTGGIKKRAGRLRPATGALIENVTGDGIDVMQFTEEQRLQFGDAVLEVTGPCEVCLQLDLIKEGLKEAVRVAEVVCSCYYVRLCPRGAFNSAQQFGLTRGGSNEGLHSRRNVHLCWFAPDRFSPGAWKLSRVADSRGISRRLKE
jgi:hypothetical protein